uniref:Sugar phosphate phosphatase n=1 Tax=Glossina austeni TaxID=7395 RepID=A0A1A9UXH6_GLOAU
MSDDFRDRYDILDIVTPRHALLAGRYKKSFAYSYLRDYMPVILTQIIDNLLKDKDEIVRRFGEILIGQLSKLKYQLQTDKPFEKFENDEPDKKLWNEFIDALPKKLNSFFRSCWLYAECYIYRKVSSFFEASPSLKSFDYFEKQKQILQSNTMIEIARSCRRTDKDKEVFHRYTKLDLWSNLCDHSFIKQFEGNLLDVLDQWDNNILVNNTRGIWNCLQKADHSKPVIVDFVCNDADFELYADFVLAEYLIEKQLASKVRLHVKPIPWCTYDATLQDVQNLLQAMRSSSQGVISEQGRKWKQYFDEEKFVIAPVDYFWVSAYEYFKMREINLELYKYLSQAHLVIFKGNLHYRKLLGDYCWDPTDNFLTCIRGFQPTNICTLRTIKSDLVCGLQQGQTDDLRRRNHKWMTTGEYGLIQFVERIPCGCSLKEK